MEKSKFFERIGWVGMVTSILMYVFYFRVIQQNLSGHPGDPLQPLMAGINCTLWVAYGVWRQKKDWSIAIANAPGIIFGGTAAITALM